MPKLEARGIRCLDCTGLDLKGRPEQALEGFGRCQHQDPAIFVAYEMSRNCWHFDTAAPDVVARRDIWAEKQVRWWRRP